VSEKSWTEKRKYPRAKTRKKARYRIIDAGNAENVSRTNRGVVVNIGEGGMMLGVKELVSDHLHLSYNEDGKIQNWLAIEIDLMPGRSPIRALAKVVWYQKATNIGEYDFDVGLEFQEIREEDRKTIRDFVSRFQKN
jgi:c-di-GMP-binding flagellar brake protein YcgR